MLQEFSEECPKDSWQESLKEPLEEFLKVKLKFFSERILEKISEEIPGEQRFSERIPGETSQWSCEKFLKESEKTQINVLINLFLFNLKKSWKDLSWKK